MSWDETLRRCGCGETWRTNSTIDMPPIWSTREDWTLAVERRRDVRDVYRLKYVGRLSTLRCDSGAGKRGCRRIARLLPEYTQHWFLLHFIIHRVINTCAKYTTSVHWFPVCVLNRHLLTLRIKHLLLYMPRSITSAGLTFFQFSHNKTASFKFLPTDTNVVTMEMRFRLGIFAFFFFEELQTTKGFSVWS